MRADHIVRAVLMIFIGIGIIAFGPLLAAGAAPRPSVPAEDVPRSLAVDPRDGSLLKVTSRGIFRGANDGQTWRPVTLPSPLGRSGFGHILANPDNPMVIYVAGLGAGVVRSEDGGVTWRSVTAGLPSMQVEALAIHAFRRATLFAAIRDKGVFRTEDGGQRWQRMDAGPSAKPVLALAHSPLPGSMNTGWLYAGTSEGPYISMDCF